jgi:chemotaxis protein CheD
MKIAKDHGDILVTHALGSCLGITAHDSDIGLGGILHVMLPHSNLNPERAQKNPFVFVDTGVPSFFEALFAGGAKKHRLIIVVAGGAAVVGDHTDHFAIGRRNHTVLRKLFWKNNILIHAEDVGGNHPRTMYLEIGSGRTWVAGSGWEKVLTPARQTEAAIRV